MLITRQLDAKTNELAVRGGVRWVQYPRQTVPTSLLGCAQTACAPSSEKRHVTGCMDSWYVGRLFGAVFAADKHFNCGLLDEDSFYFGSNI